VLGLLSGLPYRLMTTYTVRSELDDATKTPVTLHDVEVVDDPALNQPLLVDLDAGEASVIQLAPDRGIRLVCIDEKLGRRQAEALGLRVAGTLGLLRKAKQVGIVDRVRPIIEKMRSEGVWYSESLVNTVLKSIGE
jgi:predicted nucleic acid-binding protein